MKVLIIGGYGFIGSHAAERFYKEGHKIFIIDNLSTGSTKNLSIKTKAYNLDICDKKCEEVFKANSFDVVIYLVPSNDMNISSEHAYLNKNSSTEGLISALELSKKYEVKKFIYISSAAVYGGDKKVNPISTYGMAKVVGEFYCEKWRELYGLNTLIIRTSNVYGPRQQILGEGGIIAEFIKDALDGEDILLYGYGGKKRDFIYVEDLVDAIYKCTFVDFEKAIDVCSGTEYSINEVIDFMTNFHPIKNIVHVERNKWEVDSLELSNEKAKQVIHWEPKYDFYKGLELTFNWYKKNLKSRDVKEKIKKSRNKVFNGNKYMPYIENVIGFIILFLINFKSLTTDINIINGFDYSIIYIILISIVYGTRQSVIAVIVSSFLYFYRFVYFGGDIITFIYDPRYLMHIMINLIIGLFIGYNVDKKNNELIAKNLDLQSINEKYDFLQSIYSETLMVKEQLQEQILNSEDLFGRVYETTRELSILNVEDILQNAVIIMEKFMKGEGSAIYLVNWNKTYLRLVAKSKEPKVIIPNSIKLEDFNEFKEVILNKEVFINKKLNTKLPIMAAPIVEGDNLIAVVCIFHLEFDRINLYVQNMFKVLVGLISSSLVNAYTYERAIVKDRFIEGANILKEKEFLSILKTKINAKDKLDITFCMLKLINKIPLKELNYRVLNIIREHDYIGVIKGEVYILLSNVDIEGAKKVMKRLEEKEIYTEIVEEDEYFE